MAVRLDSQGERSDVSRRDRRRLAVETMTDFLTWSPISLGRWFGTAVRVHFTLVALRRLPARDDGGVAGGQGTPGSSSRRRVLAGAAAAGVAGIARAGPRPHGVLARLRPGRSARLAAGQPGRAVLVPRSSEHLLVALAGPLMSGAVFLAQPSA